MEKFKYKLKNWTIFKSIARNAVYCIDIHKNKCVLSSNSDQNDVEWFCIQESVFPIQLMESCFAINSNFNYDFFQLTRMPCELI